MKKLIKTKLPRKRKKAYIKALGRNNYLGVVFLAKDENESKAKFWKVVDATFNPVSYW